MKRIKILHLITTLDIGGAEKHLLSLVRGLKESGYEITVGYLKGKGELIEDFRNLGIKVIKCKLIYTGDISIIFRLYRLMKKERYNIVHTHLFKADFYGGISAKLAKVPIIISSKHNEDQYLKIPIIGLLGKFTANLSDRIIVISEAVRKFMVNIGLPSDKLVRIYYGIELNKFDNLYNKTSFRETLNIEKDTFLIGMIGRLEPQKGHRIFLEASVIVSKQLKKVKFLIVGEGSLRKKLEKISKSFNIHHETIFTGIIRNIHEVIHALDVLIIPSLWEGFGLVSLEAMAAKKPIIATQVGALPEIIIHNVTGLIVKPNNSEELASYILKIANDKKLAEKMGKNGRKRIERYFDIDIMINNVRNLYNLLIEEKRL